MIFFHKILESAEFTNKKHSKPGMQGLTFLEKLDSKIFAQKWLLGNIKYFVSFKLKSLKSNSFRQNIAVSNH